MQKEIYMLRLSNYTLFKKDKEKYLLFNSFSKAFLGVEFDDFTQKNIIDDLINGKTISEDECPDDFSVLMEQGIITNLGHDDEKKLFENTFYSNYFMNNASSITLAPSLSCNLNCKYCYQSEDRQESENALSEKDWSAATYEFVKNFIDSKNLKKVSFVWFGGEPLVAHKALREFSRNIKKYYADKPVKIEFEVITNGTIINKDVLLDFNELPVKSAQITIDGTEKNHDMVRYYKDGQGTYRNIMDNIRKIIEQTDTNVSIRYNLCSENADPAHYKSLISYMAENFRSFIDNRRLSLEYPVLATDTSSYKNDVLSKEYSDNFLDYLKTLFNAGIDKSKLYKFAPPFCTARSDNSLVIGPNGHIYKCWEHIGKQDYVVGNTRGGLLKTKENEWKVIGSHSYHPKCLKCKLLPTCMGGCPLKWGKYKNEPECPFYIESEVFWNVLKFIHKVDN